MYLNMSFAALINTSAFSFENFSVGFQAVFSVMMIIVLTVWPIFVTVKVGLSLMIMPSFDILDAIMEQKEGGELELSKKTKKKKKGKSKKKKKAAKKKKNMLM